jgi:hypothetical protein
MLHHRAAWHGLIDGERTVNSWHFDARHANGFYEGGNAYTLTKAAIVADVGVTMCDDL